LFCAVQGLMRRNWLQKLSRYSPNGFIWMSSRTAVDGLSR